MTEDKVAAFTQNTKNVGWVLTVTVGSLLISIGSVQFLAKHTIFTAIQENAPANTGEQTTSELRRNQDEAARRAFTTSSPEEWMSSEYRNILETVPSGTSNQEILEILIERMAMRRNPGAPSLSLSREQVQGSQDIVQSWIETPAAEKIRAQVDGTWQVPDSTKNSSIDSDIQASLQRHIDIKSNVFAPFVLGFLATLSIALIKTAFHATILLIRESGESTVEL